MEAKKNVVIVVDTMTGKASKLGALTTTELDIVKKALRANAMRERRSGAAKNAGAAKAPLTRKAKEE